MYVITVTTAVTKSVHRPTGSTFSHRHALQSLCISLSFLLPPAMNWQLTHQRYSTTSRSSSSTRCLSSVTHAAPVSSLLRACSPSLTSAARHQTSRQSRSLNASYRFIRDFADVRFRRTCGLLGPVDVEEKCQ